MNAASSFSLAQSTALAALLLLLLLLVPAACLRPATSTTDQSAGSEITVAAAANLTDAFAELAKEFTARTGVRVTYSFGSTGDLARQIENNAPFDVFASADAEHLDQLRDKNLIVPETRSLFARGRLVLWTPSNSRIKLTRIEDLIKPEVKIIAIAKPDLAPYGKATIEALEALRLWSQLQPKIVYGQNVSQTKQYAATGNAEAAFIPLALVKASDGGETIEVDEQLHQPINQTIGVVAASTKQLQARQFVDYVMSAEGQALLERFGYRRIKVGTVKAEG